jgi:hypothetical protein
MPNRLRFRRALPLLFALLAIAGLLGRGATPLGPMAPAGMPGSGAGPLGILASMGATICHTDPAEDRAPGQRHVPDCALCPVCHLQAPAAQLLFPSAPVIAAAPAVRAPPAYSMAEARAPPATTWRPARPRGPPSLS